MTHEQYLNKLKLLNIKTVPIEKYINSKTSILHKCICGNNRNVTPSILYKNGDTCRKCMNKDRNTHKEYVEKLKERHIKTIPIENYKSADIKIKHKCICGNIRNISPSQLYRTGDKCKKCMNDTKLLTENYINKLKEKSITIKLIGEYKGLHTKTEHLCDCGNIWEVKPSSILHKNTKCGCVKKNNKTKLDRNFYKDKPTVLYYIRLNEVYKIGITLFNKGIEQSINRRYSGSHKDKNIELEIIDYKLYTDGEIAYLNEQEIMEMYKEEKYIGENFIKTNKESGGESECFTKDIHKDIEYYFK